MGRVETIIDGLILTTTTSFSIANIEYIFSILLLVLNCIWLFVKIGIKIYKSIKSKQPVEELKEDLTEDFEDLKEFIENAKKNSKKRQ